MAQHVLGIDDECCIRPPITNKCQFWQTNVRKTPKFVVIWKWCYYQQKKVKPFVDDYWRIIYSSAGIHLFK